MLIGFGYGRRLHRSSNRITAGFMCFAALGFLVCLYTGAEAMLFWFPSNWGFEDVDGDYQSVRSYLAAWFTLLAGISLLLRIEKGACQDTREGGAP